MPNDFGNLDFNQRRKFFTTVFTFGSWLNLGEVFCPFLKRSWLRVEKCQVWYMWYGICMQFDKVPSQSKGSRRLWHMWQGFCFQKGSSKTHFNCSWSKGISPRTVTLVKSLLLRKLIWKVTNQQFILMKGPWNVHFATNSSIKKRCWTPIWTSIIRYWKWIRIPLWQM